MTLFEEAIHHFGDGRSLPAPFFVSSVKDLAAGHWPMAGNEFEDFKFGLADGVLAFHNCGEVFQPPG